MSTSLGEDSSERSALACGFERAIWHCSLPKSIVSSEEQEEEEEAAEAEFHVPVMLWLDSVVDSATGGGVDGGM